MSEPTFAELVKEVREGLGLSQRRLSLRLGMSQSVIHDWEHGEPPSTEGLANLVAAAGLVDADELALWRAARRVSWASNEAKFRQGRSYRGSAVSSKRRALYGSGRHEHRFGQLVRLYRTRQGLSQMTVAVRIESQLAAVQLLERGRALASLEMIGRLSDALGLAPADELALWRAAGAAARAEVLQIAL